MLTIAELTLVLKKKCSAITYPSLLATPNFVFRFK